jgi:hypothetical protein
MTSGEEYMITEEDINKYGGEGMCVHLEECIYKLDSRVCGLIRGFEHSKCPVNVEVHNDLLKNPDYVKRQESIHKVAVDARQVLGKIQTKPALEKIRERRKKLEGKKTDDASGNKGRTYDN